MPQDPQLTSLQRPQKLSEALKADRPEDCLSCRLTGSAALVGLGGYSYFSGQHQLRNQEAAIIKSGSRFGMRARQMGLVGIAGSLVGMGIWRLIN